MHRHRLWCDCVWWKLWILPHSPQSRYQGETLIDMQQFQIKKTLHNWTSSILNLESWKKGNGKMQNKFMIMSKKLLTHFLVCFSSASQWYAHFSDAAVSFIHVNLKKTTTISPTIFNIFYPILQLKKKITDFFLWQDLWGLHRKKRDEQQSTQDCSFSPTPAAADSSAEEDVFWQAFNEAALVHQTSAS